MPTLCSQHLPHNPGDQDHGGIIEGIEETNEQLTLGPQLPQSHTKDDSEDHQAQDVHSLHLTDKLQERTEVWGERANPSAQPLSTQHSRAGLELAGLGYFLFLSALPYKLSSSWKKEQPRLGKSLSLIGLHTTVVGGRTTGPEGGQEPTGRPESTNLDLWALRN